VETEGLTLSGTHVRLEPLNRSHLDGLVTAAAGNSTLYQWSLVPQTESEAIHYIDTAVAWRDAGTAVPFAIVLLRNGAVIGSTRFWNLERWSWPEEYPENGRRVFDVCELGHTWLSPSAIRTAANTEAKLLLLTHAFEHLDCIAVEFRTHFFNHASRRGIERLGAKLDGILRSHQRASDGTLRDTCVYSIIASEWPTVKSHLTFQLTKPRG